MTLVSMFEIFPHAFDKQHSTQEKVKRAGVETQSAPKPVIVSPPPQKPAEIRSYPLRIPSVSKGAEDADKVDEKQVFEEQEQEEKTTAQFKAEQQQAEQPEHDQHVEKHADLVRQKLRKKSGARQLPR